jgi:hypothetical protein
MNEYNKVLYEMWLKKEDSYPILEYLFLIERSVKIKTRISNHQPGYEKIPFTSRISRLTRAVLRPEVRLFQ